MKAGAALVDGRVLDDGCARCPIVRYTVREPTAGNRRILGLASTQPVVVLVLEERLDAEGGVASPAWAAGHCFQRISLDQLPIGRELVDAAEAGLNLLILAQDKRVLSLLG